MQELVSQLQAKLKQYKMQSEEAVSFVLCFIIIVTHRLNVHTSTEQPNNGYREIRTKYSRINKINRIRHRSIDQGNMEHQERKY